MPWIAPAAMAVGSIASGAIGAASAGADRDAAKNAWQQSVSDLESVGIPTVEAQKIAMQRYQSAGQWTPELEQLVNQSNSEMNNISTDPNYRGAQLQALSQLQDLGKSGGMTLTDQANQEKLMGNAQAAERGSREAILQDAQSRGGYGSGTALMAQLMNSQNSANQQHSDALNTAAQAQARALQAIEGAGNMGTQLQTNDFSQQAQKAQAQDAINKWNAQNAQQVQGTNTAAQNQASQYNLTNAQNLSNANTDTANKEQLYNSQLQQQYYQNQMQQKQAAANARAGQASNLNANANSTANMWGGIGSAISQGVGNYAQMQNYNDQQDKNRQAYGNSDYQQ